jgi:WD40 repeat protein
MILLGALAAAAPVQEPAVIKPRASFPYSSPLLCMAVSPDGKAVAYRDNTGTHVWDVATGKRTATLTGKPSKDAGTLSLAYRPDGKVVGVGSAHRQGGEVRLHDLAAGKSTQLKLPRGPVSLAFSADGAFLITVAPGTNITVWDTKTGKAVTTLPGLIGQGGSPDWVAFGAREKILVRATRVRVEVWDRATGKRLKWFEPQQQPFNTNSCRITPDGKTCFQGGSLGGKGLVRVWDVGTGKQRGTLEGQKGAGLVAGPKFRRQGPRHGSGGHGAALGRGHPEVLRDPQGPRRPGHEPGLQW